MENVRKNTLKCQFDRSTTRPSPADIHEWITNTLHITVDQVDTLQLDSYQHAIFVKFISQSLLEKNLRKFEGQVEMILLSGERIHVNISAAGVDATNVRVFNLPPEVSNTAMSAIFAQYGTVREIRDEHWSSLYKCNVKNGIRVVRMELKAQIPSVLRIAGCRAQILYDGQVKTCSICSSSSHLRSDCTQRMIPLQVASTSPPRQLSMPSPVWGKSATTLETQTEKPLVDAIPLAPMEIGEGVTSSALLVKAGKVSDSDKISARSELQGIHKEQANSTLDKTSVEIKVPEALQASSATPVEGKEAMEGGTNDEITVDGSNSTKGSGCKAKSVMAQDKKISPYSKKDPRIKKHGSVERLDAPVRVEDFPLLQALLPPTGEKPVQDPRE